MMTCALAWPSACGTGRRLRMEISNCDMLVSFFFFFFFFLFFLSLPGFGKFEEVKRKCIIFFGVFYVRRGFRFRERWGSAKVK